MASHRMTQDVKEKFDLHKYFNSETPLVSFFLFTKFWISIDSDQMERSRKKCDNNILKYFFKSAKDITKIVIDI